MLQITAQTKILLAVEPVDFRKGIEGLAAVCRLYLRQNPYSGTLFVFRNRKKTTLKILGFDGQGMWLCMKRLSKGRLNWWPTDKEPIHRLSASQLHLLLWNVNPSTAQIPPDWRKVE